MPLPSQEYDYWRSKGLDHKQVMRRMSRASRKLVRAADRRLAQTGQGWVMGDRSKGETTGHATYGYDSTGQLLTGDSTPETDTHGYGGLPSGAGTHAPYKPSFGTAGLHAPYKPSYYTVKTGDTYSSVSNKMHYSASDLAQANKDSKLRPGTTINLPPKVMYAPAYAGEEEKPPWWKRLWDRIKEDAGEIGKGIGDAAMNAPQLDEEEAFGWIRKLLEAPGAVDPYAPIEELEGQSRGGYKMAAPAWPPTSSYGAAGTHSPYKPPSGAGTHAPYRGDRPRPIPHGAKEQTYGRDRPRTYRDPFPTKPGEFQFEEGGNLYGGASNQMKDIYEQDPTIRYGKFGFDILGLEAFERENNLEAIREIGYEPFMRPFVANWMNQFEGNDVYVDENGKLQGVMNLDTISPDDVKRLEDLGYIDLPEGGTYSGGYAGSGTTSRRRSVPRSSFGGIGQRPNYQQSPSYLNLTSWRI